MTITEQDRQKLVDMANGSFEEFLKLDQADDPSDAFTQWMTVLLIEAFRLGHQSGVPPRRPPKCHECAGHKKRGECIRCNTPLVLAVETKEHRSSPGVWWRHINSGNHRICGAPYPTNQAANVRACACTVGSCGCQGCRLLHELRKSETK